MNPPSFFCGVCNKAIRVKEREKEKERYCKDCLKSVTADLMHLIDQEPMEGTPEQQKHVWNLYVEQYGDLKERFVKH